MASTTGVSLKRPADSEALVEEPALKKLKPETIAAVKKQLEYYLSDQNLLHDKFFHDKISANAEGWLDLTYVLSCNNIKRLLVSVDDICQAVAESTAVEVNAAKSAVRRTGNKALPKLTPKPLSKSNKNNVDTSSFHSSSQFPKEEQRGGLVLRFVNVPEDTQWGQIKGSLRDLVQTPEFSTKGKIQVLHTSTKKVEKDADGNDHSVVYVALTAFDRDIEMFKNRGTLKIVENHGDKRAEGQSVEQTAVEVKVEVLLNLPKLDAFLADLPKYTKDARKKAIRNAQQQRAKQNTSKLTIGRFSFTGLADLKKRIREIQQARADGEELKEGMADYQLISELLKWHPTGPKKMENMKGLKVDNSGHTDAASGKQNRCFFVIKNDGSCEDFSMAKILDEMNKNPPIDGRKPTSEELAKISVKGGGPGPDVKSSEKDEVEMKSEEAKTEEKEKPEEKKEDVEMKGEEAKTEEKAEEKKEEKEKVEEKKEDVEMKAESPEKKDADVAMGAASPQTSEEAGEQKA